MVNLVAVHQCLLHWLMKMAGIAPQTLEIEPGTFLNIWAPVKSPNTGPKKPAVVLLHGFAGDGIYNWQLQVLSLTKKYSVYMPDLMFFGGSGTDNPDRSVAFQAECVVKGLRKVGVERCTVVGFSYGGMVGFKMAELHPEAVEALVVTGAVPAMTDSISAGVLEGIGFSSFSEFLLPTCVEGCKKLLKCGAHWVPWLPNCLYKDFIEVMFNNRKERAELVQGLMVNSTNDKSIPKFPQRMRIHLLWGEEDQLFNLKLALSTKRELGEKATFQGIKKAGHLVHLERPSLYNTCLNNFLDSLQSGDEATNTVK